MATITNILGTDNITDSREVINTNFDNLNADKIEADAIADFETTTQLNARDTANRNRANHTGTQTASTISDFDTEVSNNTDVSANTSARHTHSNKATLDQIASNPVETIVAGTNVSVSRTGNSVTINSTGGGGGATALDDLTDVTITTPANGQALTYNGTQWVNSTPAGGGDMLKSVYDTNDDGIVNQADVITNQGDLATLDSVDTAQITNGAVENTKLANMNANTVKGRLSGNGTPQDVAMADLPISTATQSALDLKANDNAVVKLTGNQTIAGVKTFSSSPIVPTPTTDMQVATKKYVDDKIKVKQHRITIPGELIADTSNYQGLYFYNDTGATITISNVAFAVGKAAAGSGAACAMNIYKSSGTAADGLNTNAVNLFTTAVDLGTGYTSLTNVPNTATVENGRWVTLRVTSSAGATNRASDLQCIITYT